MSQFDVHHLGEQYAALIPFVVIVQVLWNVGCALQSAASAILSCKSWKWRGNENIKQGAGDDSASNP